MVLPPTGKRIGYACELAMKRSLEIQRAALREAHCDTVHEDTSAGKRTGSPRRESCLAALDKGDTLVVWRLDCLANDLSELVTIIEHLEQKGIVLESLIERVKTTSSPSLLFFTLYAALSQFDGNVNREHTRERAAKTDRGKSRGGRRRVLTPADVAKVEAMLRAPDVTAQMVADRFNVGRATIYRYLKKSSEPGGAGGSGDDDT